MNYPEHYLKYFELLVSKKIEGYKTIEDGRKVVFGVDEKYWPEQSRAMWDMKRHEAKGYARIFYYENFWKKINPDSEYPIIPHSELYAYQILLFDLAVNSGVEIAQDYKVICDTWEELIVERMDFYWHLANRRASKRKYFRGWIGRLVKIKKWLEKEIFDA